MKCLIIRAFLATGWLGAAISPCAGEMGVDTYPGATIVDKKEIGQIREGRYQVVNVFRMYSTDSFDAVKSHYQSVNPGWAWRDKEGQRTLSYPVQGASTKDDLPGASGKLLSGPRVYLSDITLDDNPMRAEIRLYLEKAPGSRSEIKIEYPGPTSELIDVDDAVIANTTQRCVSQEAEELVQSMNARFPPGTTAEQKRQRVGMLAEQHCSILHRACAANPKKIACQRLLRMYVGGDQ